MPRRRDWNPDDQRVIVVAGGQFARDQAHRFGVYQCQNGRSFRPARWIAFYSKGAIDTLAEIDGAPEDGVLPTSRPELQELAAQMPLVERGLPRTVFRLRNLQSVGPIKNDTLSKSGRPRAWTQSQRYTTISKIRSAKRTSELLDDA